MCTWYMLLRSCGVWFLSVKPFFLPVDIQHTECPVSLLTLRPINRDTMLCGHKITPYFEVDTINTAQLYIVVQRVDNAMPCHGTRYDKYNTRTPAKRRISFFAVW